MQIFKFPNGATLDLSNIEERPCKLFIKGMRFDRIDDKRKQEKLRSMNNPFIPKDNYITRILGKLEEERLWRVLENHAKGLEVEPKYLKVIFSDNGIIHKAPPSIFLMWYKNQMNDLHNQFQRDWIKTFGK